MVLVVNNIAFYFTFLFVSFYEETLEVVENPTSGNIATSKNCNICMCCNMSKIEIIMQVLELEEKVAKGFYSKWGCRNSIVFD